MPVDTIQWLHVVAAVIMRDDLILLAQRPHGKHQGGKWEFPGGKVEPGETALLGLARELLEELGIVIVPEAASPYIEVRYQYPEKNILLDVWLVTTFSGEPEDSEGQPVGWFRMEQLAKMDFPAANAPIIDKLLAGGV